MSGKTAKAARRVAAVQAPKTRQPARRTRLKLGVWVLLGISLVVGGLYVLSKGSGTHGSSSYPYQIGSPGPGKEALPLELPSTSGGTFNLASYKGKAEVLLFFQEGLTCEPCWTQLKAIQKDEAKFRALGIDKIVSITTDPINLLQQKVRDERITIPVLADVDAGLSTAWQTNRYQMMMMGDRNGHSFILVGKNGRVLWRADYGGAPKYTMFLPDDILLAQMQKGMSP